MRILLGRTGRASSDRSLSCQRVRSGGCVTPEVLATIGSLAERYGLPLVILGGFLYLILSGRLVTGSQLTTMTTLFERERADRLAAEAIVAKFAPANAAVAESIEELASALLEGRPAPKRKREPYGERLEGNRGRS